MKTKNLLLMAVLFIGTLISTQAQTKLVEEEFSSSEWETEFLRLNPGNDEFGVPINPNATNPVAYVTPPPTGGGAAYNNLNSVDLYFNKYRLSGAVEVLETGLCSAGLIHAHPTLGTAVAFRLTNPGGRFELPELPSVGKVTIHVKNGNPTNDCNLGLEKYNAGTDSWEKIHLFLLRKRDDLKNENQEALLDEAISYDVNSSVPVRLRLNNIKYEDGLAVRFINMYRIEVTEFGESSVPELQLTGVKQIGRRIVVDNPMHIAVYNVVGKLIMEQNVTSEMEIPASFGQGVFMLKTSNGNQKIVLQ
jgi:hypothetical protein